MATEALNYAEFWSNDKKMDVLFSHFRDRSVNPQSWEQKMDFWQHMITERCELCGNAIVDPASLSLAFGRNGKTPQCLDTVLREMERTGKLMFLTEAELNFSNSWLSWGYHKFIKNPLHWAFDVIVKQEPKNEEFVHVALLTAKAQRLLESHLEKMQTQESCEIVEYSSLFAQHQWLWKDNREFPLILSQLIHEKKALVIQPTNSQKETLIKITNKSNGEVTKENDIDLKIYRIQKVQNILTKQVDDLSEDMKRYTEEARMHIKMQSRRMAFSCLKRRKHCQKVQDKKIATLDILHDLLYKIKNVSSDEMILQAYEVGVKALKNVTKNISVDKTQDVIENLQDLLEEQQEISDMLSTVEMPCGVDADPDKLEAELKSLTSEDSSEGDVTEALQGLSLNIKGISENPHTPKGVHHQRHEEQVNMTDWLPDVPSFSPSGSEAAFSTLSDTIDIFPTVPSYSPQSHLEDKHKKKQGYLAPS